MNIVKMHHDFLMLDGVLQQQFQHRKFHGIQTCKWHNGATCSVVYEKGPFSYAHGHKSLHGVC